MFVFYDWPFPNMCTLQRMQHIFLLILGSVFSDCVDFYGDIIFVFTARCYACAVLPRDAMHARY